MHSHTPDRLADDTKRLSWKAIRHIAPLLGLLGLVAYFDRISVAFAGPHGMNDDLELTATAFGFVVGVFTIGYVLFEVPSGAFVTRLGPRRWIVRVMLTWGLIQCLIAFAPNFELLLVGRFLLGVAEAGFTPSVFYLFTVWFIRGYRPILFMSYGLFIGVSGIFGPALAGVIVEFGNNLAIEGHPGWRFLLLVFGLLALVAAIPAARLIADNPDDARWLTQDEKQRYKSILAADAEGANAPAVSMKQVLLDWRPWVMGFGFFSLFYATYTITIWAPTIVAGFQEQFGTQYTTLQASLITGIPTLIGVSGTIVAATLAAKWGRSAGLTSVAATIGAVGCFITTLAPGPGLTIVALGMVALGGQVGASLFIPIVTRVFAGTGAYAAIALVNSMGAFAGFVSPTVTGALRDLTSNQNTGFYVMIALLICGALITMFAEGQARRVERTLGTANAAALLTDNPSPAQKGAK